MYSIYTLADPRTHQIRYVGISKHVHLRFRQHMARRGDNMNKEEWIQDLAEHSLAPVLNVIATGLTCEEAQLQEYQLIKQYYKSGEPLTNSDGITSRSLRGIASAPRGPRPKVTRKQEALLTVEDVGKRINRSAFSVRNYIARGELEGIKVGPSWRVRESALSRYLARNTKPELDKK